MKRAQKNIILKDLEKKIILLVGPRQAGKTWLAKDEVEASRWRLQYINSLLSTDIFEIDTIHNLKGMRLVFDLLRERVGSPVSYQSLAEDVSVSPHHYQAIPADSGSLVCYFYRSSLFEKYCQGDTEIS
ncbi:MAG: hypothetical protein WCG05_00055 [Alphaproteobacteria bacterium]